MLKVDTDIKSLSHKVINDLYMLNRNFCSDDYDKALNYIQALFPNASEIHTYTNSQLCNGWTIPPKWDLKDAYIKKDGHKIYDATLHPLQVICMSTNFEGLLSLDELKKHLHHGTHFTFDGCNDAIPFHFRQLYQNWKRDWGFNVSTNFYNSLSEGDYEVFIGAEESEGDLKILEINKKGETDLCFYFVAHLDHPGMANDDLSGCAVGLELFKRLEKIKTKFSYKLLLIQEITGSNYYLNALNESGKDKILGSLFLEMLGSETTIALQHSHSKSSLIDNLLLDTLTQNEREFNVGDFGTIIGNDEIVFESYGISMPSLSRFPFPEYHTDKDNMDIISIDSLNESIDILHSLVLELEKTIIIQKKFDGLVCLSNPDYDLYVDLGMKGENSSESLRRLRLLMNYIPLIKGTVTINELVQRFDIDKETVLYYLKKWEEKELLEII